MNMRADTSSLVEDLRRHAFDDCGISPPRTHIAIQAADRLESLELLVERMRGALEAVRKREADVADDEHMACGIRNYSRKSAEIIDEALSGTQGG